LQKRVPKTHCPLHRGQVTILAGMLRAAAMSTTGEPTILSSLAAGTGAACWAAGGAAGAGGAPLAAETERGAPQVMQKR
jgi:hypothetical protein